MFSNKRNILYIYKKHPIYNEYINIVLFFTEMDFLDLFIVLATIVLMSGFSNITARPFSSLNQYENIL